MTTTPDPVSAGSGLSTYSGRATLPRYSESSADSGSVGLTPGPSSHRHRRWPWAVLAVMGLVISAIPVAGAMFYPAAQGDAMISDFAPYMSPSTLRSFDDDLRLLESVRSATVRIDAAADISPGQYPQLATFAQRYPAIDADMTDLLKQIDSARGDYDRLQRLQPLSWVPFIPLGTGLLLLGAGIWGFWRAHNRRRPIGAALLAVVTAGVLAVVPVITPMAANASAAGPLVDRFSPVLTTQKVREVQGYFVVMVGAVGEIDSRYLGDLRSRVDAPGSRIDRSDLATVERLSARWQPMSSDFAGLVGVMNDNVANFDGVADLEKRTRAVGFGAFEALPWALGGLGAISLLVAGVGVWDVVTSRRRAASAGTRGE
ncbi:hypothetical protein [Williamsia sp. CHRR-6]|uniref:hypothetical protein n=1 Tax=Williamsia sp. CHRR-6 TaxID=2835871 RepID=UPI001BDB42D2|nr:hypothetical protein [Williamsia sp. CHRR-6]MBT0565625.1 hypothetical protein [Williamsia sp. CHRR-6]